MAIMATDCVSLQVRANGVSVWAPSLYFLTSVIVPALGPLGDTALLYAPTEAEADDVDLAEEAKVAAFVQVSLGRGTSQQGPRGLRDQI